MKPDRDAGDPLRIERRLHNGVFAVLIVSDGDVARSQPRIDEWIEAAGRIFAANAEIASVSVVAPEAMAVRAAVRMGTGSFVAVQAESATLPVCFLNGRVTELAGVELGQDKTTIATFREWIERASAKGLVHVWLARDATVPVLSSTAKQQFIPVEFAELSSDPRPAISLGIDAAWLLGGESGAQVFVYEMIKELVRRPEVERVVLISDTGGVPGTLAELPKVAGVSWADALARGATVDILHRPYQPGEDVDYRRYHRVAGCVALTVLDFIAYDNCRYHESSWAWRRYQAAFDENVCLADAVFAISGYVGSRLERQFADRLPGGVRAVLLGTDHLRFVPATSVVQEPGPTVRALEDSAFVVVLGNDFEHKNRDFAVKVFAEMRDRGYQGRLVLAGYHLDNGSSFGHELAGAGRHATEVVRMGAVSTAEKTWLLSHADAILYPTSSEGFGLIPFEAAALGTPTAFVGFGPLLETLPGVSACGSWQVSAFADHVFSLIADPAAQVEQIRIAGAALTWASHVDQLLTGYRSLLSPGAPWRTRVRELPGPRLRARRTLDELTQRAANKLRRITGRL